MEALGPLGSAVICDRMRAREIFMNLLANALKYNDKPCREIEIGCVPGDGGKAPAAGGSPVHAPACARKSPTGTTADAV